MANQKNLEFLQGKPPAPAQPAKKYSDNASYDDYEEPYPYSPKPQDPTATEHAD